MNRNFAGIPDKYAAKENAAIWLQSIPYDGTSTWGKGANRGFEAFMDAADNMELYDIETGSEVYRRGIHLLNEIGKFDSPAQMFNTVYQRTKELLDHNKFLTFFGGEHSISIGIIKAHYEHFKNLSVLQLDAHCDLRPSCQGTPYNHACALFDASRHCNLVQVGIRSMASVELSNTDTKKCYLAKDIANSSAWMEHSTDQLTENVYITLDLDVFDPSVMPATGTPEPGGMTWYSVVEYLKKVFSSKNVVGFDIVELAPIEGLHSPQFLAAKLYYKMLSYKFS